MSGRLIVVRHGRTEWSALGRHTGLTDIPLSADGENDARGLAVGLRRLGAPGSAVVWCSPLRRARATAELAGLQVDETVDELREWDYGEWEGRTTAAIREEFEDPSWTAWTARRPGPGSTPGESVDDVGSRADTVIDRALPLLTSGSTVVAVAHAHLLRILTARWLGLPADRGALFRLETAGVGMLGFERENRVLLGWDLLAALGDQPGDGATDETTQAELHAADERDEPARD